MSGKENRFVTFNFNKYGEPEMLDVKNSVAQSIINALFMVPGNLPSLPHVGVDIRSYLYRSDIDDAGAEIENNLKVACGHVIHGVVITKVEFAVQRYRDGDAFLLMIHLSFPQEGTQQLGVAVMKEDDIVKFNFAYAG